MGIKIFGYRYVRKELDTIYTKQNVFKGKPMKRGFNIGSYRIDLYFRKHKLCIECNEHNLKDEDMSNEMNRKHFIECQLNCKLICYNPDAEDFTIVRVLNSIFQ